MRHAKENALWRQPGDIEFALPERAPCLGHERVRQGRARGGGLLAIQGQFFFVRVELPDAAGVSADVQDVADMPASHGQEGFPISDFRFTHPSGLRPVNRKS